MFSPTQLSDETTKSGSQESSRKEMSGDIYKIRLLVNLFVTFKNNVSSGTRDILSTDINNIEIIEDQTTPSIILSEPSPGTLADISEASDETTPDTCLLTLPLKKSQSSSSSTSTQFSSSFKYNLNLKSQKIENVLNNFIQSIKIKPGSKIDLKTGKQPSIQKLLNIGIQNLLSNNDKEKENIEHSTPLSNKKINFWRRGQSARKRLCQSPKETINVYAYWKHDSRYYHALLNKKVAPNKYQVVFADGFKVTLPNKDIVIIDNLKEEQDLFVNCENIYLPSKIVSISSQEGRVTFNCLCSGQIKNFQYKHLAFNEQQVNALISEKSNYRLSSTKHKRLESLSSKRKLDPQLLLATEMLSPPAKILRKGSFTQDIINTLLTNITSNFFDNKPSTSKGLESTKTYFSIEDLNKSSDLDDSFVSSEENVMCLENNYFYEDKKGVKFPKGSQKIVSPPQAAKLLGPRKPANSSVFKNNLFVLTCAKVLSSSEKKGDITEGSSDANFTTLPFSKSRLFSQIIAGGGKAYTSFKSIDPQLYSTVIVISNRPCLTATYIKGLAYGCKMLNHEFIIFKSKGLDVSSNAFLLPSGISFISKKIYLSKPKIQFMNKINLGILTFSKNSYHFWEHIIQCFGGTSTRLEKVPDEYCCVRFNYILVDPDSFYELKLNTIDIKKYVLLKPEWLIESIFQQKKVICNKFFYN